MKRAPADLASRGSEAKPSVPEASGTAPDPRPTTRQAIAQGQLEAATAWVQACIEIRRMMKAQDLVKGWVNLDRWEAVFVERENFWARELTVP